MAAWNLATGVSMVVRARLVLRMILIHLILGVLQGVVIVADGAALLASSPSSAGVAGALIGVDLAVALATPSGSGTSRCRRE